MANVATYQLLIPKEDEERNPLQDLVKPTFQWINNHATVYRANAYLTPNLVSGQTESLLNIVLDNVPESDSLIKQACVNVAEIANRQSVTCSKVSNNGPERPWILRNPSYKPGPADESVRSIQDEKDKNE